MAPHVRLPKLESARQLPVASAVNWVTKQGQADLVDFAVGVGLLDKTHRNWRVTGPAGSTDGPWTGYDTATLVEDIRQFLDALTRPRRRSLA